MAKIKWKGILTKIKKKIQHSKTNFFDKDSI